MMGDVGMEEEMGQASLLDQGVALLDERSREHVAADVLQLEVILSVLIHMPPSPEEWDQV